MISSVRFIDRAVTVYIESRLKTGHPEQTKEALQELCSLYRRGFKVRPEQLVGIEAEIVGLSFTTSDPKVRRWALNSLAQLGREKQCKGAIIHCIDDNRNDPEIVAAGIAAIYKISQTPTEILKALNFDPQMSVLAALQHAAPQTLDLSCLPLRVENADPELLKLALVLVGLNKAPPNIFEPNFSNAQMLKAVGKHHDHVVSQYSVWAVTENPNLTIRDIGFEPQEFEKQPENVRAWIYQLVGNSPATAISLRDYVKNCMDSESPAVKSGLAEGLKNTYSIILEPMVLEWFTNELDNETSRHIVDHFIKNSGKSDTYKAYALDAYQQEPVGSPNRERMEATAPGTPMFSLYNRIRYSDTPDLFRGVTYVAGNNYNIGNMQAGAVSFEGNASNTGLNHNTLSATVNNKIKDYLANAAREIKIIEAEQVLKENTLKSVVEAQDEPTPDKLTKAASALESFEKIASSTVGAATALAPIALGLAKLIGLS